MGRTGGRLEGEHRVRHECSRRRLPAGYSQSTQADWVGAFVDLRRTFADRLAATRFFLEEIDLAQTPRNWLHNCAVEAAQLFTELTTGNPIDQQLAAQIPPWTSLVP